MVLEEVIEAFRLIDSPSASGELVAREIERRWERIDIDVETSKGKKGSTDFLKAVIPGSKGKIKGGGEPTALSLG